ncbi:hypothetical protein VNI00_012856 [Paramarasmius palmivorus]|uniref:Uncharacterized protein n=1 Tax=Paramarasmius palmivorus TaxID=297713 RepID=A0AAW0C0L5_9AGAR
MRNRLLLLLQCIVTLPAGYGLPLLSIVGKRTFEDAASHVSETIRETWINPSDTLSVLLLIGGDVVLKAIAQLTGLCAAPFRLGRLLLQHPHDCLGRRSPHASTDYPAKVINVKSGFARDNRSWVLGRLLRDHDIQPLDGQYALCITVYQVAPNAKPGVPELDWCWWLGVVTIIIQLGVSAIPFAVFGDWSIFLVTVAGTILSLLTSTLPQWGSEKWACRRKTDKVFCLTGGNGQRRVMVILSNGNALDLEDLAGAESPMVARNRTRGAFGLPIAFLFTQAASLFLAALWILMLITVTGIKEHAWFLLLVGGFGMLQNALAAGAVRRPGTSGVHLEEVEAFKTRKVMWTIMDFEKAYPKAGRSLLEEFFPGKLRPAERAWWDGDKVEFDQQRKDEGVQPDPGTSVVREARSLYKSLAGLDPSNATLSTPTSRCVSPEHSRSVGRSEKRAMSGAYQPL